MADNIQIQSARQEGKTAAMEAMQRQCGAVVAHTGQPPSPYARMANAVYWVARETHAVAQRAAIEQLYHYHSVDTHNLNVRISREMLDGQFDYQPMRYHSTAPEYGDRRIYPVAESTEIEIGSSVCLDSNAMIVACPDDSPDIIGRAFSVAVKNEDTDGYEVDVLLSQEYELSFEPVGQPIQPDPAERDNALKLLERVAGKEARERAEKGNEVEIISKSGGAYYLCEGRTTTYFSAKPTPYSGHVGGNLCYELPHDYHPIDTMVAEILLIQTDEQKYLELANKM